VPWQESRNVSASALILRLATNVLRELHAMRGELGASGSGLDFANLQESSLSLICGIDKQIRGGRIDPWWGNEPPLAASPNDEMRLGVFPIAANPLHWAHLLAGLFVMERYGLDRIFYVVAGSDPRKPALAPEEERHAMARAAIALFSPLLAYSPIARGTDFCGEESLFRLLAEYPDRTVEAFYIAGSDHYQRTMPATGSPDTITRLENGISRRIHGHDPLRHKISAVFLERGERNGIVPTWLDVLFVPGLPVQTSSTAIRAALADGGRRAPLWTLPYVALKSIRGKNLYKAAARNLAPTSRDAGPPPPVS
jgi:nicotinic acid mononucleotide adenylyltransferase